MSKYCKPINHVMFGMSVMSMSMSINEQSDWWAYSSAGSAYITRKQVRREISMDISIAGFASGLPDDLIATSLVALGDGKVCPACQTYWPTGSYLCWNCGCQLDTLPFIKPEMMGGVISGVHVECPTEGVISLSMTIDNLTNVPMSLFLDGSTLSFETIEYVHGVESGLYLCGWCGLAVKSGQACYGCGGPRTPLRELVDMQRECSWCGNQTINGIICQQCGMRVGGRTIGDMIND